MASARLFRVILPVNDIDASATFYSALLDDAGMRVSPGRHYFDCGGVVLALYSPRSDGDDRTPRPNLGSRLSGGERSAGRVRARQEGGRGEVSFYLSDPSGNPLCFVDASTLFTRPPS